MINMDTNKANSAIGCEMSMNHQALGAPKVIHSEALFSGQRELTIQHMGQLYRLRQTQQGKLILTK